MLTTKLTDFTSKELQSLLNAVYLRLLDCRMFISSAKEVYEKSGASDYVAFLEFQDIKSKVEEIESLELWRTQILNAIGIVGVTEQIRNN